MIFRHDFVTISLLSFVRLIVNFFNTAMFHKKEEASEKIINEITKHRNQRQKMNLTKKVRYLR